MPVLTPGPLVAELFLDEVVLVGRADHPLAHGRATVRNLAGHPFVAFESGSAIRRIIDTALAAAGVEIEVVMELRSIPSMLRMVTATGALAFVSRISLTGQSELRAIPVKRLDMSRTIGLARHPVVPLSPAAEAFSARLRELDPRLPPVTYAEDRPTRSR
jgi:DNA-binding transcriptional LysR family regulator